MRLSASSFRRSRSDLGRCGHPALGHLDWLPQGTWLSTGLKRHPGADACGLLVVDWRCVYLLKGFVVLWCSLCMCMRPHHSFYAFEVKAEGWCEWFVNAATAADSCVMLRHSATPAVYSFHLETPLLKKRRWSWQVPRQFPLWLPWKRVQRWRCGTTAWSLKGWMMWQSKSPSVEFVPQIFTWSTMPGVFLFFHWFQAMKLWARWCPLVPMSLASKRVSSWDLDAWLSPVSNVPSVPPSSGTTCAHSWSSPTSIPSRMRLATWSRA